MRYEGGCNAPRTVGTLGRGELSPSITITAVLREREGEEVSRLKKNTGSSLTVI